MHFTPIGRSQVKVTCPNYHIIIVTVFTKVAQSILLITNGDGLPILSPLCWWKAFGFYPLIQDLNWKELITPLVRTTSIIQNTAHTCTCMNDTHWIRSYIWWVSLKIKTEWEHLNMLVLVPYERGKIWGVWFLQLLQISKLNLRNTSNHA